MKRMTAADFENAQEAREALTLFGFVPTTSWVNRDGLTLEYWMRAGRYITLAFNVQAEPAVDKVALHSVDHAEFVRQADGSILVQPH
jgi:hypothetical protein